MNTHKPSPWNWLRHEASDTRSGSTPVKSSGGEVSPLMGIHQELDRWMDRVMGQFGMPSSASGEVPSLLRPSVDIAERDKEYVISVEVPGVEEKDIKLNLEDDQLIIEGEKRQEEKSEEGRYQRIERSYGSFRRMLNLPADARKEEIQASFNNGVLTVTIPRDAEAAPKRQEIPIKH
ncbi:Hsp20/alpha crystallin family protein [Vreelandella rituensis]|uniref:Hsp20/alpha crystallin family protein n=2 Tax=Vreelandella rituensis TaxID=2282306 RepID=A0A368U7I5_9GAMM|nr:Hsp20/alpha crystallin family protein [Halomonas rituensis]RCV92904.1 Hsp20/alpha crystallin family protein [Halomonas rituensis]